MNLKKEVPSIAICIATYMRPKLLQKLLVSLNRQSAPKGTSLELRIVDNDSSQSSQHVVETFLEKNHIFSKVHYIVEPTQNIAHARNAALNVGEADAIAFIDDDEEAPSNWIHKLWDTYKESGADGVFGPVDSIMDPSAPKWIIQGSFMSKSLPPTGEPLSWKETRTSNALIKGKWFYDDRSFRFDPDMGRSGGSDTHLFARLQKLGARFVSCRESIVFEHVPKDRSTFSWLWKRRFRNGLIFQQIVSTISPGRHPTIQAFRRFASAILWIAQGLIHAVRGEPSLLIKGALQVPLALGGLKAWIKPSSVQEHVAYKSGKESTSRAKKNDANKFNVAFLTNIVSPYRVPVFKTLSRYDNWNFKIFTNASTEFDRSWKVDVADLSIKQSRSFSWKRSVKCKTPISFTQSITFHLPYGLFFDLLSFRPSSIISHELGLRTFIAAIYCFFARIPLVIWAYQSRISGSQGPWRDGFRKWLLRRAERVVGMGIQSREVLNRWGVPNHKIHDAPNATDLTLLTKELLQVNAAETVKDIRKQIAGGKKLALYVGRLIPLKGIDYLLSSWEALPKETRSKWHLAILGEGPLESLVSKCTSSNVSLIGHVDSSRIGYWYTAADLHIFPTCGDVWGLVVNEASVCGTPTLCSVYAGCSDDLINHGFNGLSIDFINPNLSKCQLDEALNRSDLEELGTNAQRTIAYYTPERLANSFREAVNASQLKKARKEEAFNSLSAQPLGK